MNVEIRPCRDAEELKEYGKVVSYVFASTEGMDDELATTAPDWTTCAWVDGRLASTLGAFPFTVRLNGAPVSMGGVTAVGTLPEFRRQGLLRQVMRQALSTMRDRKQAYAILWASMGAIYQRFGYGIACPQVVYQFDPRYVQLEGGPAPSGKVTLMSKEDAFATIKQLYVQWATPRNLHIHRAVPLWEASTLRPRKKGAPIYVGVYHNADGTPTGYIVYDTHEEHTGQPGPAQVMNVKDFIPLDLDAYRGLWEYIRRHDLVGKVEMHGAVGEDDPAPELLLEPRMLRRQTNDGIWMRVVDVEAAIPQRPYGGRGELVIALPKDDMCPWNEGTYRMETDGITTAVTRVDAAPDLTMRPNTLATLLAGHRSATRLHRAGLLEASGIAALERADTLFRTVYAPNCPNGF
jgi:predicted acetyltransferase